MTNDELVIDFRKLMAEEKKRASVKCQPTENNEAVAERKHVSEPVTTPSQHEPSHHDDWKELSSLLAPTLDLSLYCVSKHNNPGSIHYVPDFLHQDYTNRLIPWLQALPSTDDDAKQGSSVDADYNGKWTTMKYGKRRVALFDGTCHTLPIPLLLLAYHLVSCGIFDDATYKPNHVLVNEYTATQGIMPHTDGPLYHDVTATISIGGGDVLLKFTPRRGSNNNTDNTNSTTTEVHLEGSGSLVVFSGNAYTNYCHGIEDGMDVEHASDANVNAKPGTEIVRGYRLSLTFRHKYATAK